jgi:hypothetical protein
VAFSVDHNLGRQGRNHQCRLRNAAMHHCREDHYYAVTIMQMSEQEAVRENGRDFPDRFGQQSGPQTV